MTGGTEGGEGNGTGHWREAAQVSQSQRARPQGFAQANNLFSVSGRDRSEPAFVATAGALVTGVAFRATFRRNNLSIYLSI